MAYFNVKDIAITGVATAVPKEIRTSESYIEKYGEKRVQKFVKTTGIGQVRVASQFQTASDLGYVAAEQIIKEKNMNREEIGILIFASHGPDYFRPATSCVLQHRLALKKECACLDINLGCSAFVYATQVIGSMMMASDVKKALLIVGDTNSKMVYPEDESMCMLTGDAASAVLFERKEDYTIQGVLKNEGDKYQSVIVPAGALRNRVAPKEAKECIDGNMRTLYHLMMDGYGVFEFTIRNVPESLKEFLVHTGQTVEDFDCYAMHQANYHILQQIEKRMKFIKGRMPISLDRYGNTSSASIPLVLCDAYGNDERVDELNVLMSGFGVGLSLGVMSAKIAIKDILPIMETDYVFEEGILMSVDDWKANKEVE